METRSFLCETGTKILCNILFRQNSHFKVWHLYPKQYLVHKCSDRKFLLKNCCTNALFVNVSIWRGSSHLGFIHKNSQTFRWTCCLHLQAGKCHTTKTKTFTFTAVRTSCLMSTFTFFRSQDVEKIDIQSTAPCCPTTASHLPSALNESDGLVVSFRPLMYLTDCETSDQMQMETCQH